MDVKAMKRFFLEFDVNRPELNPGCGGCYNHIKGDYDKNHCGIGWNGNSMRTMKNYIRKIRKEWAALEPHDFRIYDYEAPDEPDGHVGQVYHEP